jgi:hypothetical protein
MHQQVWGYKVEDKLYVGVREQETLNTTVLDHNHAGSFPKSETYSTVTGSGI